VSDLERSIDFYTRLLGLRVRWRGTTMSGTPAAHIGDERSYLAVFEARAGGKAPADYASPGLNHMGFVVGDLDAARACAIELGASPGEEQDYEPGRRFYVFDPDGIEVELVEYAETTTP
jgi:catechol 2,3-dioxygenase-like lactoylglutathione lyase family enzyme